MKKLTVIFLLLISFASMSQTSLFFTPIDTSTMDIKSNDRGPFYGNGVAPWDNNSGNGVNVIGWSGNSLNSYVRFTWRTMESTQGNYTFTGGAGSGTLQDKIERAIDSGQRFSFGMMPMCDFCGDPTVSGGTMTYPVYLHKLMQREASSLRDWLYTDGPNWIPNWNSVNYLNRLDSLNKHIASFIATGSYHGVNYSDVVYFIDIRGYGNFGEWHTYPWTNAGIPYGKRVTSASLKRITGSYTTYFPSYQLMISMGAFSSLHDQDIPLDVIDSNLSIKNSFGPVGIRKDDVGSPDDMILLEQNPDSFGGHTFADTIMARWKRAPWTGEPNNQGPASRMDSFGAEPYYFAVIRDVVKYHMSSFNNYNYGAMIGGMIGAINSAYKASGYRLLLTGGSMTTTLVTENAFNITINWRNFGVAPVYDSWPVTYELRNTLTEAVIWSSNSSFNPKLFLPSGNSTVIRDNFTLPTVTPGTYKMVMIIRDPVRYRAPLQLGITGRNADGSYLLRYVTVVSNISFSSKKSIRTFIVND